MYVCICHAVRESDLVEAVQEGQVTFQAVRHSLGCGRSCGHCKRHVQVVIEATVQAGRDGSAQGAHRAEAAIDAAVAADVRAEFDGSAGGRTPCELTCGACPGAGLAATPLAGGRGIIVPQRRKRSA